MRSAKMFLLIACTLALTGSANASPPSQEDKHSVEIIQHEMIAPAAMILDYRNYQLADLPVLEWIGTEPTKIKAYGKEKKVGLPASPVDTRYPVLVVPLRI